MINTQPDSDLARISGKRPAFDDHGNDIFFAAVSKTRMPMIVTDPRQQDNPIVFANHAFLNMTGYSFAEIQGKNCRLLQGPETDRETVAAIREAVANNREMSIEVLNYRKDGSSFWNALFISPVLNERNEVLYFFASQLDISRRRDAESALHRAQQMEALGQLTGGIAHDFNNLLQVMSGYSEVMELMLNTGKDSAALRNPLSKTRTAIQKAATLTQQLLAFARKQELRGRAINLNALVQSMLELAQRTLGEDIVITPAFAPDLPNCRLDPTQFEMAALNILANAKDALLDRDRPEVRIRTERISIEKHLSVGFAQLPPGVYASVVFSDSGCGIAADILDHVMNPFFTTKEEGKGTGLGLSMVYGFVKQSGGFVNIYSEADVGTTIRLYFPAIESDAEPIRDLIRTQEADGAETVLVVDDRPEVAELAQVMLEQMGYTTVVSYTPVDALSVLKGNARIDLLFTDLIMPGSMNGVMLAREAKRINPDIKVLLTTGYADAALGRSDTDGVEFEVLQKPYQRVDLARKVRIVLNGPTGVS